MSINVATQTGINNGRRNIPAPYYANVTPNVSTWTRPVDWPTLPTVTTSDQKVTGLYAVFPNGTQTISFTCTTSAGTYTVDWGDTTSNTYASGVVASKTYNYATLTNPVLTGGYKAVTVTITPTTNNLTGVDFGTKFPSAAPNTGTTSAFNSQWLDLIVGSPTLTSLILVSGTIPRLLQQFQLMSCASSYTNICQNLFASCLALRSIPTLNVPANVTTFSNMFGNCQQLTTAPSLSSSVSVICTSMFQNCYSLTSVPNYTFTISIATTMFTGCSSLQTAPSLNLSSCTNTQGMFQNCYSLIVVPAYNTSSSLTTTATMFSGCYSLVNAPFFNTSNVTTMAGMFLTCYQLRNVPLYNTISVTNMSTMFQFCQSLTSIPLFNTINLVTASNMFQYCFSLKSIPLLNTSNVTTALTMFGQCYSLTTIPLIDTSKVTNMTAFFFGCTNLQTIPLINTSNVTNMNSMFTNCNSLNSIPLINTIKVTDMASMFQNCPSLSTLPLLNMANVQSLNLTFYQCYNLTSIPTFNTVNCTNFGGTFASTNIVSLPALNTSKGTNFASYSIINNNLATFANIDMSNCVSSLSQFITSCPTLQYVPALDLSKATSSIEMNGNPSLIRVDATGMNVATTFSTCRLDNSALTNIFANGLSIGNGTSRIVTISSNPGAETAVAKTGNMSAGLQTIAIANTVGVTVGMFLSSNGFSTGNPVTFTDVNDLVHFTNIGASSTIQLANNDLVLFTTITTTTGIVTGKTYYVRDVGVFNVGSFRLSATLGGAVVTLTTNGSGILTMGSTNTTLNTVATVNTNTNVIMNGYCSLTNAAATLSFSNLNRNLAISKNWVVTG
jgi:surface protein